MAVAISARPARTSLVSGHQQVPIALTGLTAAGVGVAELLVIEQASGVTFMTFALTVVGIEYVLLGWLAWARRPGNRTGLLMVIAGLMFYVSALRFTGVPALIAAGVLGAALPVAVVLHTLLAFPSGVLRGLARPIAAGLYAVAVIAYALGAFFGPYPPPLDVLTIEYRPALYSWTEDIANVVSLALYLATAGVLWHRLRQAEPSARRVLGPMYAYSFVAAALQPAAVTILLWLGNLPTWSFTSQVWLLAGTPVAFVGCLLLGGFGRTSELHELGAWLGSGPSSRTDLLAALRRTLGDPTLEVMFRVRDGFVDVDGRPAADPVETAARGVVEVRHAGESMGVITYDAELISDREAVEAVGRVAALALQRERLTAELVSVRGSLRTTLADLVERSDRERRRIVRDLHDGLQSKLVVLGMAANNLQRDPTATDPVRRMAGDLQSGLTASVEELRRLVDGVMPAVLVQSGLHAAARDLLDELPLRAHLTTSGSTDRMPEAVESAGYFVLTEAVTNVLKYAKATELWVTLERLDDRLRMSVRDNGNGGARFRPGGGLSGLADRLGALGGSLHVGSESEGGSRLDAELPLPHGPEGTGQAWMATRSA